MHKTIYLVRHGQASAGTHDYDRLSPLGETQAQLLGEHWETLDQRPGFVRTGTLRRQRQTAVLARCLHEDHGDEHLHGGLDEYDHRQIHSLFHPAHVPVQVPSRDAQGRPEDMPTSMTFDTYSQLITNWMAAEPIPDGNRPPANSQSVSDAAATAPSNSAFESWASFQQRTLDAVRHSALHSTEDSVALYTSGGVISVVTAQIENLPVKEIPKRIWTMKNASITTLNFDGSHFSLLGLNDVSHLEAHQNEQLITMI